MKTQLTQKEIVLEYLKKGKKISQRKAFAYFSIIRLSAVIWRLKKDGYEIDTYMKDNVYNDSKYAEYTLKNSQLKISEQYA